MSWLLCVSGIGCRGVGGSTLESKWNYGWFDFVMNRNNILVLKFFSDHLRKSFFMITSSHT